MRPEVKKLVHRVSGASGVLGVLLSPLPLADELTLVPLYAWMTMRIARHHRLPLRGVPIGPIATTAMAGLAARAALNVSVAFMPGVAAIANAVTAVMLTEVFGGYVDAACVEPEKAKALGVDALKEALLRRQT
jgi:uncharacterized protein (DUF697 family)